VVSHARGIGLNGEFNVDIEMIGKVPTPKTYSTITIYPYEGLFKNILLCLILFILPERYVGNGT
jgi:hypothetical protein